MNEYYAAMLAEMESPAMRRMADRILLVMENHRGRENAITRKELEVCLRPYYRDTKDLGRKIRKTVEEMRKRKVLILSCAGSAEGQGYFMAKTKAEAIKFCERELRSKIVSMSITLTAIEQGADEVFGPAYQEALI